jgi:hypothetical protein
MGGFEVVPTYRGSLSPVTNALGGNVARSRLGNPHSRSYRVHWAPTDSAAWCSEADRLLGRSAVYSTVSLKFTRQVKRPDRGRGVSGCAYGTV